MENFNPAMAVGRVQTAHIVEFKEKVENNQGILISFEEGKGVDAFVMGIEIHQIGL